MISHSSKVVGGFLMSLVLAVSAAAFDETRNEMYSLMPSDAVYQDRFGSAVDLEGATALSGAWFQSARTGAVYVYDASTGSELFKLTASDGVAGDGFGVSVGLSGNTAVIGTYAADAAYLFDVSTGQELFKLTASDDTANDEFFGYTVAIDGTTAIVGAPFVAGTAPYMGAAYVYDVATGQQLFKLTASDGAESDFFGQSVAISGTTAIISAHNSGGGVGAAYLFDVTTGAQIGKLTKSGGVVGDYFGLPVAIQGDTALISALEEGSRQGAVYVFDVPSQSQLHRLVSDDGFAFNQFGNAVDLDAGIAVIGAYQYNWGTGLSGAAYSFDLSDGHQIAKLVASVSGADWVGVDVAVSGSLSLVGASRTFPDLQALMFYVDEDLTAPTDVSDLESSSHTTSAWSNVATLDLSWTSAIDTGIGLDGYSYVLDQVADTVPSASVLLDETATSYSEALSTSLDGYYFHIRAADICDNWSDGLTVGPYFVDLELPVSPSDLTSSTHTPGTWSTESEVSFEWTASTDAHSGLAGYGLSVTAAPELANAEIILGDVSQASQTLADGEWWLNLRAADVAGNWEDTGASLGLLRIDATAPSDGTITIAGGAASTASLIVELSGIAATEVTSGLDQVQFSNDGVLWSPPEAYSVNRSDWNLSAYGGNAFVGTKTVYVRFFDIAGNVSASFSDTIEFDPGQPAIGSITPARGPGSGGNTVTITGSGFTENARVLFGGTPGSVTFISTTELQVVVPVRRASSTNDGTLGQVAESVSVVVRTDYGRDTLAKGYTYTFRR